MEKPMIAAHTGCGSAPDNTMASFLEGVHSGANIVEVDVHVTMDGTAMLQHDDSPYLHRCTFEQLNEPDMRILLDPAHKDHPLVKLEEIIRISEAYGVKLNLDLKSPDSIEPTVHLIREFSAQKRAFITGCSDQMTERFPDIHVLLNTPTSLTSQEVEHYDDWAQQICRDAKESGYFGLNMHHQTCRKRIVEIAHEMGLIVWVYTVNDQPRMREMIEAGVDAITTREVARLQDCIA